MRSRLVATLIGAAAPLGLMAIPSGAMADSCVPPYCPAPTVVTGAAQHITKTTASVGGKVNPNGSSTTYYFQYGQTTSYGQVTPTRSAGNGTSFVDARAELTHLKPCTRYHYRLVAQNAGGTATGSDQTFKTKCSAKGKRSHVRILGKTARLNGKKTRATVRVQCHGGSSSCKGKVTLRRHGHKLGSGRFRIKAHKVERVRVKLNATGRRVARNHKKTKVRASARSTNHTGRDSKRLTLKR